jgi:5-(carboxyamino)imidazole ribonucleotide synthase
MSDITLGIIGSGQLGSLLCQAAKKLNVKTVVISDDEQGPAQNFSNEFIYSKYDNESKIVEFIDKVNFVTFEFENIPLEILKKIDLKKKVLPKPEINKIIQNRKLEKTFVNDLGIKTTDWAFIKQARDIQKNKNLLPGILKSNTLGYDGHGQFVLNSLGDIKKDWCFTADYILEKKVDLKKEISVIITRFTSGETFAYEPIENLHKDQILKHSKIPANINKDIYEKAQNNAKLIADKLDYVGTMCVEYFIDQDDNLLVNEIAPRVHNSGHLTISAFNISQFENHVRAVCGFKFEKTQKNFNAEMINILGKEIEEYRSKTFEKGEFFFDYGKKTIKEKRKMGHLTILKK